MKFDLQKNKLFLVTLGIVVVIVVVTLVLWRGSVNSLNEASANFETANSDYETLCKNYNGAPCEALQKAYEADLEALKKQAGDFVAAVKTEKLNVLDPSNFKIELRKYDNEIKATSASIPARASLNSWATWSPRNPICRSSPPSSRP